MSTNRSKPKNFFDKDVAHRRFLYKKGIEIYVPLNTKDHWVHINGKRVMLISFEDARDIRKPEVQAKIVDQLKKKGFLK